MRGYVVIVAGMLCVAKGVDGQTPAAPQMPCAAPDYRQFDFWVGNWEVKTPAGKTAGTSRIERINGGCAIQEHWTGNGPSRGTSFNFFETSTAQWNQLWLDNSGLVLRLTGGLRDGRMVLENSSAATGGRTVRQRITWSPLDSGRVRQHWEQSADEGKSWSTVFDGIYSPRKS
jgi:hypothetical protein